MSTLSLDRLAPSPFGRPSAAEFVLALACVAGLGFATGCPRSDTGKSGDADTGADTSGDSDSDTDTDTATPAADCDFGEVPQCSAQVDLDGDGVIEDACDADDADQQFATPVDTADPEHHTAFGYGLGTLPDLDGDGIEELVISEPYGVVGYDPDYEAVEWHGFYAPLLDHVYFSTQLCDTGATLGYGSAGATVRASDAIEIGDTCVGYVSCDDPVPPASLLHSIGDLDGDGLVEVAMPDYDPTLGGVMAIHSGARILEGGEVLHTEAIGKISHQEGFLYLTGEAGDPNGDAVPDLYVEAANGTYLCAGTMATGGASSTTADCASSFPSGTPLQNGPADYDGDGVDDVVLGVEPTGGGVLIWWGATTGDGANGSGSQDATVAVGSYPWGGENQASLLYAWQVEDVDGDSLPELLATGGSGGYVAVLLGRQLAPQVSIGDDGWFRIYDTRLSPGGTIDGAVVTWGEIGFSDTVEQYVFPAEQVAAGGTAEWVLETAQPILKVNDGLDQGWFSVLNADLDGDHQLDLALVPGQHPNYPPVALYLAP